MSDEENNDKKKISFSLSEGAVNDISNTGDIVNMLSDSIGNNILEPLEKSIQDRNGIKSDNNNKNKVLFSSRQGLTSTSGSESKGYKRLGDNELREISILDPYISAIISTRCSQASVIARESESKFDKGTRILDLHEESDEEDLSDAEKELRSKIRKRQSKEIMNFIWNCGTDDQDILDDLYRDDRSDKIFKKCTLADYFQAQTRNLLTFGRYATHIIRDDDGQPVAFRPVPVETIMHIVKKDDVNIARGEDTFLESIADAEVYNDIDDHEERPAAYVQRVGGQNVNFFTEDELKITYFQKQAFFDLRGYPLSSIELAIYMVFIHQNTLSYLRNHFTKGLGTKGILSLTSTDPGSEMSPEDLDQLRNDFHNFLMRNDNSSVTPIISGPVTASWIPFTGNPRDMEYLQVEEHVIRALCSAFLISPQEMGYGHLSMNQGGLTSANKQEDIIQGEERGLRVIMDLLYDDLNDIVFENFPTLDSKFQVSYTGIGEDTRDAVISRGIQEMETTATMNSLFADSEKKVNIPIGGDVPLSSRFHQNIVPKMKYGEFMEKFMGKANWGSMPEYDFIMDPALEQLRNARTTNSPAMLSQSGALSLQQQEMELKSLESQIESQAQMMMQPQPEDGSQPPQEEAGNEEQQMQPEENEKSISEEYRNRMRKSYFSSWINAHINSVLDDGDD